MKRAALYLRVSTEKQTTDNQRPALEQAARARGFEPVVFEEVESAKKARPVYEDMLTRAHAGEFAALFVVALDRLERSHLGAIRVVLALDSVGVQLVSLREPWLDTGGPARGLLVSIFGWVAEQERATLVQRTKAGIERARRQGKHIGRPKKSPVMLRTAMQAVREDGQTVAQAARVCRVSESTLRRALRTAEGPPKPPVGDSGGPSVPPQA